MIDKKYIKNELLHSKELAEERNDFNDFNERIHGNKLFFIEKNEAKKFVKTVKEICKSLKFNFYLINSKNFRLDKALKLVKHENINKQQLILNKRNENLLNKKNTIVFIENIDEIYKKDKKYVSILCNYLLKDGHYATKQSNEAKNLNNLICSIATWSNKDNKLFFKFRYYDSKEIFSVYKSYKAENPMEWFK